MFQLPRTTLYIPKSHLDWNYSSKIYDKSAQCHNDQNYQTARGKMLGGTSSANGMIYVRGNPDDFHKWAEAANDSSWDWDEVLPYFIKSERLEDDEVLNSSYRGFHGMNGYLGVTRQLRDNIPRYLAAFEEIGHKIRLDINGEDTLGYTQPMFTIADGLRQSTAYAFLTPIKQRSNLHVVKNTLATKVIFKGNKAIGVEVITENNGTVIFKASKEIILSAGAINSPQLLMLSGIGPRDHLKSMKIKVMADLPVGQNLQDHRSVIVSVNMQKSNAPSPPVPKPTEFAGSLFVGLIALNKSQSYPDYQTINLIIPHDSAGSLQRCSFNIGIRNEICQRLYDAGRGRDTIFTSISILRPKTRGQITLRSTNPSEAPSIDFNFNKDIDLENLVKYIKDFSLVMKSSYFRRVKAELVTPELPICDKLKPGSREYWFCYAHCLTITFNHYAGTCALGTVVDSRLRVHGVRGLRVADASIMPTITSGNTYAPTIMIGEKASDMIKQDYVVD